MGWIISPSEGVTNYDNGSFKLPCSESNVTYSITYVSDEGCSSNTISYTYVTSGSCDTPACTCDSLTVTAGSAGAASGGSFTLGSYAGDCLNGLSASTTATWIDNDSLKVNSDKTISGTVGINSSTSERTATITVTATECASGKTFTYKQNGTEVTCPTQSNIINTNTTVVYSGGTQVAVMQILKNSTYTAYTITATSTSSSYVSNINQGDELHDDWYVVLADVTANPNTSDRSLYFDVVVEGPTLGSGCTYNGVTVTQNGACEIASANCTKWQGYNLPATGASDYPVAVVGYCHGYTAFTEAFATSYSFVRNIRETSETGGPCDIDGRRIAVDLDANTSTSTRNFTINFTGRTSDGKSCTQSLTWTQDGASTPPTPGACDNLGLTATTADVGSGVGNVSVGTISGSHTISAGTGTPSWITVKKGIGDPAPVSLTIQQNTSTSARTGTVTFNVDGTDCDGKTVSVTQSGSTGPQPWEKTFYYNIMLQGIGGGTVNKTLAFKIGVLMSGTFVDEGPIFAQQTTNVTGLQGSWQPSAASFKKVDTIQIEGDPTSDAKYITIKASEEGTTEPYELLPKAEIPLNGGVRAGELIFHTPYTFDKPMGTLYFYFDKT